MASPAPIRDFAPKPPMSEPGTRPGGPDVAAAPHHRIAILGAGFGGLGMAIRLLQKGERDLVVFEKADEVGGAWRDNTYPGCQCDVASNIYSFSFAPNPDWSRTFAWQGEILAYLRDCADRFGVRPYVRFRHEILAARWLDDSQRWSIHTNHGDFTADVLISGHGGLSAPTAPQIPGLTRFAGTIFHSATWRHDHDLTGERVAVIGTGASAIQIVPAIQPKVGHMTLFQRTAPWIVPRRDKPFPKLATWLFRYLPFTQKFDRLLNYLGRELGMIAFRRPNLMRMGERAVSRFLRAQVADPALRKKLTPTYAMGCKRILLSDDYYPALTQPNVAVVTEGITEVNESGLITADGTHHAVDSIVLCTGFHVTDHPMMARLFGRDGRSIAESWSEGAAAYLGTTVAGFPNLFLLGGPNTGIGHNSMVYMLESQFTYVLGALRALQKRAAGAVEVRAEAAQAFVDEMQAEFPGTVWSSGCASWYLDAKGKNTTLWPSFTWSFRNRTRRFDTTAYVFEAKHKALPVARNVAAT